MTEKQKIIVDTTSYFQSRDDLRICILAFGHVKGSRTFFLPSGEMATDAFEQMADEAWNRLTPNQQAAVLDGRFTLTVPTLYECDKSGQPGKQVP